MKEAMTISFQVITIIHEHLTLLDTTASFNYLSLHLPIIDANVKFMTAADVQTRHSDATAPPAVDAMSITLCRSRNSPTHKIALRKPLLRNNEPNPVISATWDSADRLSWKLKHLAVPVT
jgi:hypothetical protein